MSRGLLLTRGLGGPAQQMVVQGFLTSTLLRVIRGGRNALKKIYEDALDEFKIAAALVAINGKEKSRPIFNKGRYIISEQRDIIVRAIPRRVQSRVSNLFNVTVNKIKIKRGSDGED